MSERLDPIPTPRSQKWRNIRLQYVPVVVFFAGLAAAALIWTQWVAPPTLIGEAEAIRTELRSAQAGKLVELRVALLQSVKAGEILGHVWLNEPKVLESSLAVVRAEADVLRTASNLSVEQLQLDWMNKRIQLITLEGQLQQAEATLARAASVHRIKLITDEEFDQAKSARDSLQQQVKAQAELVARVDPSAQPTPASSVVPLTQESLRAALKQKDEQLRLLEAQLGPIPLRAPIDGVVTLIYRRTGEAVSTAEPIVQITANRAERIIGFIRQPVTMEPKPGMAVEIRTRTFQRRVGMTTVAQVGDQLEPLPPSLLAAMRLPITAVPSEFGVRIHVIPPEGLTLRPGEHVDLIIHN